MDYFSLAYAPFNTTYEKKQKKNGEKEKEKEKEKDVLPYTGPLATHKTLVLEGERSRFASFPRQSASSLTIPSLNNIKEKSGKYDSDEYASRDFSKELRDNMEDSSEDDEYMPSLQSRVASKKKRQSRNDPGKPPILLKNKKQRFERMDVDEDDDDDLYGVMDILPRKRPRKAKKEKRKAAFLDFSDDELFESDQKRKEKKKRKPVKNIIKGKRKRGGNGGNTRENDSMSFRKEI